VAGDGHRQARRPGADDQEVTVVRAHRLILAAKPPGGPPSAPETAPIDRSPLLLSGTVIEELARILSDKLGAPEPAVREIATFLRESASLAPAAAKPPPVVIRDPDDAVILCEALAIGADIFVTGDKDLLEAGEVPDIRIVDPRGFWQLVREQRS